MIRSRDMVKTTTQHNSHNSHNKKKEEEEMTQFGETVEELFASAFVLVAALAWNDFARAAIDKIIRDPQDTEKLWARLLYAISVTCFAVLIAWCCHGVVQVVREARDHIRIHIAHDSRVKKLPDTSLLPMPPGVELGLDDDDDDNDNDVDVVKEEDDIDISESASAVSVSNAHAAAVVHEDEDDDDEKIRKHQRMVMMESFGKNNNPHKLQKMFHFQNLWHNHHTAAAT